jgi:hypothetical protein
VASTHLRLSIPTNLTKIPRGHRPRTIKGPLKKKRNRRHHKQLRILTILSTHKLGTDLKPQWSPSPHDLQQPPQAPCHLVCSDLKVKTAASSRYSLARLRLLVRDLAAPLLLSICTLVHSFSFLTQNHPRCLIQLHLLSGQPACLVCFCTYISWQQGAILWLPEDYQSSGRLI